MGGPGATQWFIFTEDNKSIVGLNLLDEREIRHTIGFFSITGNEINDKFYMVDQYSDGLPIVEAHGYTSSKYSIIIVNDSTIRVRYLGGISFDDEGIIYIHKPDKNYSEYYAEPLTAKDREIIKKLKVIFEKTKKKYPNIKLEDETSTPEKLSLNSTYRVSIFALRVRSASSTKSKHIFTLKKGDKVTILENTKTEILYDKNAYWVKIKTPDGREGYAFSAFLEPVK